MDLFSYAVPRQICRCFHQSSWTVCSSPHCTAMIDYVLGVPDDDAGVTCYIPILIPKTYKSIMINVYIYIYTHAHTYIYIYIYRCTTECMCMYIYIYVYILHSYSKIDLQRLNYNYLVNPLPLILNALPGRWVWYRIHIGVPEFVDLSYSMVVSGGWDLMELTVD